MTDIVELPSSKYTSISPKYWHLIPDYLRCPKSYADDAAVYADEAAANVNTICSSSKPFQLCLKTDSGEATPAPATNGDIAKGGYTGFQMSKEFYLMLSE